MISFRASSVSPDQLNSILAEYVAAERARIFRRLLLVRFGVLAFVLGVLAVLWLPPFAFWFTLALCVAAPIWAWVAEVKCERRLARRLEHARKS